MTEAHSTIVRAAGCELLRAGGKGDLKRRAKFRLSDDSLDRMNTRIDPRGIDTKAFESNPVFLWGHGGYGSFTGPPDITNVIGRVLSTQVTSLTRDASDASASLDIEVEFAPGSVNEKAEQAFRMVSEGFLRAVSIGLSVRDFRVEKGEDDRKGSVVVFTETEMLEASLVPIPANRNATVLTNAFPSMYDLGHEPSDVEQRVIRWLEVSRSNGSPRQRVDIDPKAVVKTAVGMSRRRRAMATTGQLLRTELRDLWGQTDADQENP